MKPMDRQQKKPTKAQKQQQQEIFTNVINKNLQDSYYRGVLHGSHMQCGTILDLYQKELEAIPKSKVTKATLEEILNKIFHFCELGKSLEIEEIMKNIK